jgi:uncharacterized protein (TIGR00725 family)
MTRASIDPPRLRTDIEISLTRGAYDTTGDTALTSSAEKRAQLVVIGSAADHCTEEARGLAYRVGSEAARRGAVLLTGGLGGVMESACRGAKENHGITVGIIPQDETHYANKYCDVVIATGIGWARDFATAYSADAIILIGGGAGALIETCAGYLKGKPIIAIEGSGGTADRIKGTFLDERKGVMILSERDPEKAVARALELARQRTKPE